MSCELSLLEKTALYLTYEFSMHFNPNSIRSLSAFKEVKINVCSEYCLPVFSHGPYHGKICTGSGLVAIGSKCIHVRLGRDDSMALLESQKSGDAKKCKEVEASILKKVYKQIRTQMPSAEDTFLTEPILEMVSKKTEYITAISKLISETNKRSSIYAH